MPKYTKVFFTTPQENREHMKHLQLDISTAQYLSWLLQPEDPKPTFYLLPVLSPTASNPSSHYEKHVLSCVANGLIRAYALVAILIQMVGSIGVPRSMKLLLV